MAFSSPSKIPRVEGEEFVRIREQFCLLAYAVLDETVHKGELNRDFTELGVRVMRKVSAMNAETKYLRKELADKVLRLKNMEKDLEVARASLDFQRNDILEDESENVQKVESGTKGLDTAEEKTVDEVARESLHIQRNYILQDESENVPKVESGTKGLDSVEEKIVDEVAKASLDFQRDDILEHESANVKKAERATKGLDLVEENIV